MYIVGTSGHIDHGKTSLIQALTGTDCDRLPEEKAREMTIDIGFASIQYPKFGTVSIIDVPGHERFIRNMVVGAWGVDLALLVVAVDDGWMPQTEDHFRVLQLLGVERIIVVLNKIDLGDEEMIEFVTEEVNEKLEDTAYKGADIISVSSKNLTGIDELKETIVVNLRKLSKAPDADKPYLFIDRIFGSKGYGTVVTGTLKNGIFHEDDTVHILPLNKESRIKKIESHYNELSEGNPSQRTALNLSGVHIDELKRGFTVYRTNFFTETRELLVKIQQLPSAKKIKNNTGIEILVGTASLKGKIIKISESDSDDTIFIARLKLDEKWNFYPSGSFILTNPGGYRIIGGGTVILPDYKSSLMKKAVKENLEFFKSYSKKEIIEFIITIKKWIKEEELFAMFPDKKKPLEKITTELKETGSILLLKEFILKTDYYSASKETIVDVINNNLGLNLKEIADKSKLNPDLCKLMMPEILNNNPIIEKDGRFFTGDSITEDTLPDSKKKILSEIKSSGSSGIELDKLKNDGKSKEIKDLIKLGFLISLDGNIIYHIDTYGELRDKIMDLFNSSDKVTVPEAKDAAGLSRKFILPLLNRIENEGLIKRLGDFRIKV